MRWRRQLQQPIDGDERSEAGVGEQPRPRSWIAVRETDAIPGKQLKLTLDIDLQIAAEEALEGKNGAINAPMDPRTGEIPAMVELADVRSERFCGAGVARSMEQAGQ